MWDYKGFGMAGENYETDLDEICGDMTEIVWEWVIKVCCLAEFC